MGAVAANTVVSWADSNGGDHDGALVTPSRGFDVIACATCASRHVIFRFPMPPEWNAPAAKPYTEEKPSFLAHAGEDEDWASLASGRSAREFRAAVAAG